MRLFRCLLGLTLLCTVGPALAGGHAVITVASDQGPQRMVLAWSDNGAIRVEPEGWPFYILLRDDHVYGINRANGLSVKTLGTLDDRQGTDGKSASASHPPTVKIKSTGETARIAGIDGEHYRTVWRDADGRHTADAVLTDDPTAVAMTAAYYRFSNALASGGEHNAVGEALVSRHLGLLRLGDIFGVITISDRSPPAIAFTLPEKSTPRD